MYLKPVCKLVGKIQQELISTGQKPVLVQVMGEEQPENNNLKIK